MQGLRSNSGPFWVPEKAGGRQPLLILSSLLGTREFRGEAVSCDFLPFVAPPPPRQYKG